MSDATLEARKGLTEMLGMKRTMIFFLGCWLFMGSALPEPIELRPAAGPHPGLLRLARGMDRIAQLDFTGVCAVSQARFQEIHTRAAAALVAFLLWCYSILQMQLEWVPFRYCLWHKPRNVFKSQMRGLLERHVAVFQSNPVI